jgi:hypothetical protein
MATLIPKYSKVTTANRTIAEKFAETISVKDYGAVGDGVTNDTAAIQLAIDTGKTIFFPQGSYLTTAALTVSTAGQRLFGESMGGTIIKQNTVTEHGIIFTASQRASIDTLSLIANGTNTKTGLFINGGGINSTYSNITINNFDIGVECLNTNQTHFDNMFLVDNLTYNMQLRSSSGSCIDTKLTNSYLAGTASVGLNIVGQVSGIYVALTAFQLNTTYGIQVNLNADGSPNAGFFTQCICDTNLGAAQMQLTAGLLMEFNNCWWSGAADGIHIETGMADVRIIGGEVFNAGGHGIKCAGTRTQIVGTSIRGAGYTLANTYDGIRLEGSTQTTITGVSFFGDNASNVPVTRYGISIKSAGGASATNVVGCTFSNMVTGDYINESVSSLDNNFLRQLSLYSASIPDTTTATLYTFKANQFGNYLFFANQTGSGSGGIRAMAFISVGTASISVSSIVAVSSTLSGSGFAVQVTNSAGGAVVYDYSWIKL